MSHFNVNSLSIKLRLGVVGVLLTLGAAAAEAQTGTTSDGFQYSDTLHVVTVTGYAGAGGAVSIPATIGGDPVETIGVFALNVPTITSIAIPPSVTTIDQLGIFDCSSLASISVDPANPNFSSVAGVLYSKDQSTLIVYPQGIVGGFSVPSTVTAIGFYAFSNCTGLSSVTIPGTVTSFGQDAFLNCGVTTVSIPASVTTIGSLPFQVCAMLTSIAVDPANPSYSSDGVALYNKTATELIQFPYGRTGSYTVPGTVTTIDGQSLENNL